MNDGVPTNMPTDSASSFHSATPETQAPSATEGPLPLPEESPFLSDHGEHSAAPPAVPRTPPEPPSGLSQFPPPSASVLASASATQALARSPSSHLAVQSPPPIPGYGRVVQDSISSFPMYLAGGGEDPFAPGGHGSGALLATTSSGNDLVDRLKAILVTTTDSLQGRLVEQYLGLVTAEALVPTDTLLEGAERTGRFSRYKTSQQKLKSLQQLVVAEMKLEADKLGGNAVVGSHVATTMDHGVVLVVATGTAVRVV